MFQWRLEGGQEGLGVFLGAEPSHGDGDTEAARYCGVTDHRPGGAIDGVEAVFDCVFGVHVVDYTGTTEDGKRVAIGNSNGLAASDSHGNNMQPQRPPPCIAVRIIGANYTKLRCPVKPPGKTHQSGVTFRQRLPTSPNVVYCET